MKFSAEFGLVMVGESVQREPGRTALFLPSLDGGGAERAFINLARGMVELGERVDFVVGNAEGAYLADIRDSGNFVNLNAPRLALALPRLVKYLKQNKPVRLYSALEEANILAIAAKRLSRQKTRLYPSLRNTLSTEFANTGGLKLRAMIWLARRLYPSATEIIAVSSGVADDAAKLLALPRDRIAVIANPTITPEVLEGAKDPCPHPWLAPGSPPVVLGCGRLEGQKDFATLIRAFAHVRRASPARLIILGEGSLRHNLEALADDLGVAADVALPGFDSNPFAYMARASAFVLSSLYEGSPNVVIQALALGVPVVSTDCPSGPKELLTGVASGRLVPMRAPEAMAEAIAEILDPAFSRPPPPDLAEFDYRVSAAAYLARDAAHRETVMA